jgi:hypothetical protein
MSRRWRPVPAETGCRRQWTACKGAGKPWAGGRQACRSAVAAPGAAGQRRRLCRFALPAHALGENLLVDLDTAQLRSGTVLQVGDQVLLRLMFQCEACGYLDAQRAGVSATDRPAPRHPRARAGRRHDPSRRPHRRYRAALLPAWDDDWRARVAQVLRAVPDGMVVTYAQLARLAGVQSTYCRAFPRLVKSQGLCRGQGGVRAGGGGIALLGRRRAYSATAPTACAARSARRGGHGLPPRPGRRPSPGGRWWSPPSA